METGTLDCKSLARIFGTEIDEIERFCGPLLQEMNLKYSVFSGEERDAVILQILQRILSKDLPSAGAARKPDWDKGWQENLDLFLKHDGDLSQLIPKYYKPNVPARLDGEWVLGESPDFVLDLTKLYRSWIFGKHLADAPVVAEFGCGPAWHLANLAQTYPNKQLFGFDWASSSNAIVATLADHFGWNLTGGFFDFFNPDQSLALPEGVAVYTFGALEQVHDNHSAFLDFLICQRPSVVINIECLEDLYDTSSFPDYIAHAYHKRRNYLSGYLQALRDLESRGIIEILRVQRVKIGNMNDDPYSHVVWRVR